MEEGSQGMGESGLMVDQFVTLERSKSSTSWRCKSRRLIASGQATGIAGGLDSEILIEISLVSPDKKFCNYKFT